MGIFSNSSTDEFKKKFTDTYNLISSYSYGNLRLSDNLAEAKVSIQFQELIEIAKRFKNPFNETFTFYLSSVFGEKISLAEGLIIINHSKSHAFLAKERISQSFSVQVLNFARNEVLSTSGQLKIRELLS
jgi:hypothetical protein